MAALSPPVVRSDDVALRAACKNDADTMLVWLVNVAGVSPDDLHRASALDAAFAHGGALVVARLLTLLAPPRATIVRGMYAGSVRGCQVLVQQLSDVARPSADEAGQALWLALQSTRMRVVEWLLERFGRTRALLAAALHFAFEEGDAWAVSWLLSTARRTE